MDIRQITQEAVNDILSEVNGQPVIPMIKKNADIYETGFFIIEEIKKTGKYKLYLENMYFPQLVKDPIDSSAFETLEDAMDAGWYVD
jgi:hypothetical protein